MFLIRVIVFYEKTIIDFWFVFSNIGLLCPNLWWEPKMSSFLCYLFLIFNIFLKYCLHFSHCQLDLRDKIIAFSCKVHGKHQKNKCEIRKHRTKRHVIYLFIDFHISNIIQKRQTINNFFINNGILKSNSSIFPRDKGYITKYTP